MPGGSGQSAGITDDRRCGAIAKERKAASRAAIVAPYLTGFFFRRISLATLGKICFARLPGGEGERDCGKIGSSAADWRPQRADRCSYPIFGSKLPRHWAESSDQSLDTSARSAPRSQQTQGRHRDIPAEPQLWKRIAVMRIQGGEDGFMGITLRVVSRGFHRRLPELPLGFAIS
jgi:hypothetical protein